ncbi:type IV pilus secretin PilQ, partial [Proteus mirabilis]|nr:type IV pilus secretin PilQ [Proteus mirabilis]
KQQVSLEFQDAPVTVILQALALTLRMGKLTMTREGSVMLIAPEPDAQEKKQQREALAQRQPLHSLTLTLQNGDAAEIAESLNAQRGT